MSQILRMLLLFCGVLAGTQASARVLQARIARIQTPVAVLESVDVRLDWPAGAATGQLRLRAQRVDGGELGGRFRDVAWQCPLRQQAGRWRCDGMLTSTQGALPLAVDLGQATTAVRLGTRSRGLQVQRDAALPELTRLVARDVPVAWVEALARQAWPAGRLKAGALSGEWVIDSGQGVRVRGPLAVRGLALQSTDGGIVGERLAADLQIDYRTASPAGPAELLLDGTLRGGEFLVGSTYVALPATPVTVALQARQQAAGWRLPQLVWRDGDVLIARGHAAVDAGGALSALDLDVHAGDLAPWRDRYLSGWLSLAGMPQMTLSGAADARIVLHAGRLQVAGARLHDVALADAGKGFGVRGLSGDVRFSADAPVDSLLRWQGADLYGLALGAARMPIRSHDGQIALREALDIPLLGGALRVENLQLRPPGAGRGLEMTFALDVRDLAVAQLSRALGLPAFGGSLSGRIPQARYENERLVFDGGLSMRLFDGDVRIGALALERPFGVAPSLTADIDIEDIDLLQLTGVLDAGSVSGRLDGRIHQLRLVNWTPVAFDARFVTDPSHGVRQRISQRAVQSISSVGDQSFVGSLQGQLIGLFDDFGYRRIGVSCRLANEVCEMGGLGSGGNGFTIVEGAGVPRLTVVGHNRRVDWPTLIERLAAVGKGDLKPVIH